MLITHLKFNNSRGMPYTAAYYGCITKPETFYKWTQAGPWGWPLMLQMFVEHPHLKYIIFQGRTLNFRGVHVFMDISIVWMFFPTADPLDAKATSQALATTQPMATTGAANTNQRRQKGTTRKESRCLYKLYKFGNFRDWETSRNMWCESVCTGFERSMRLLNYFFLDWKMSSDPKHSNLASQDHVPIGTSSKQCSIDSWDATCYMHRLLYATVICDISYVQGPGLHNWRNAQVSHVTSHE